MESMRQVKGTIFLSVVKAIRADKTGAFDSFLTEQDKAILSKKVMPSIWYPYETYKNCFTALARIVARNNPETIKQWGRQQADATMSSVYKSVILKPDIESALRAYQVTFKGHFDFGNVEWTRVAENAVSISFADFDRDFEPWYYVVQGWLEQTVHLVIKKPVSSKILKRSWQGAPATVFEMTW